MDSSARFRSPLRDGERLAVEIIGFDWGSRALKITYRGMVGDRQAFEAVETRGIFKPGDKGLYAGDMAELRALVAPDG
jgi:hypothetical protein